MTRNYNTLLAVNINGFNVPKGLNGLNALRVVIKQSLKISCHKN